MLNKHQLRNLNRNAIFFFGNLAKSVNNIEHYVNSKIGIVNTGKSQLNDSGQNQFGLQ
jgi:hypothetical protein